MCDIKWSRGKLRVKYLLIDSDLAPLEPKKHQFGSQQITFL